MVVNNKFLENLSKLGVRQESATYPTHMFWAGSDNTYLGDEETIENDMYHKGIVWFADGIDSKFAIELATTDAIGSFIETFGITDDGTIGSGNVLMALPSDIGTKSSNFSVEIEGRILFRRPG